MIVDLGPRAVREVLGAAERLEIVGSFRDVEVPPRFARSFEAPYVAWERVRNLLIDDALTPAGRRKKGVNPQAAMRAIQTIAREQNYILRHAAVRGLSMLGRQPGWFPAWRATAVDAPSLVPLPGVPFVILGPVWIEDPFIHTVWTSAGHHPAEHWLAHEATHLQAAGQ